MRDGRWRYALGPVLLVAGATMLVSDGSLPSVSGAGASPAGRPPRVPGCAPPTSDRAWYRIDERADPSGALSGYTIRIGARGGAGAVIEAPPESFAAGPFGGVVAVGTDDGRVSTVRLIVADSGCTSVVSTSGDVIRRATVDRNGSLLYTHRVSRGDRVDLGVWRESLTGAPFALRVLDGLETRFGRERRGFVRAFSTQLTWSSAGDELAVQTCGAAECVTRVVDTRTGDRATYDRPGQGELVALTATSLVAYEACRGLPCPIRSTNRQTHADRLLIPAAGIATTVPGDGGTVVYEVPGTGEYRLAALDLATGSERTIHRGAPHGPSLLGQPSRALAATAAPPGSVALVGGSRALDRDVRFLRLADGTLAGWEDQ